MQDMMGGFFGLELPDFNSFPYQEGPHCAYLSSGRAAFECILANMPGSSCLWAPQFICDTMLQAPARLGIPVRRYECTEQLTPVLPDVGRNEIVLLVNYFGLTEEAVSAAALKLPGRCVIDATTALYCPPVPGVPTIYSPRKFTGVADGGIAHAPFSLKQLPETTATSAATSRHLLERLESGAHASLNLCEAAEEALSAPPQRMSPLTRRLLRSIDFDHAARCRLENYAILHQALGCINHLSLPDTPAHAPMCYPLVSGIPDLRDSLIDAGIALPLYWPEVIERTHAADTANKLARRLLPLPLDQRYTKTDMEHLIRLILG
jgi:hypothetical protein